MKALSKEYDKEFARRFWKGLLLAVGAAFTIALSIVLMGLVAYYGNKYGF